MGILSKTKAKLGHFILDHLVTQQVIQEWRESHPLPSPNPTERHTDAIDEKAVEAAIKAQGLKVVRGKALDVPEDYVVPGKLAPWYWNRVNRVIDEDTVQMSAIKLQDELLKRLDGGEGQG